MKKIKKFIRRGLEIFVVILVLAVWLYSGFKILNYLRPIPTVGAFGDFWGDPPPPPPPPEPPFPPPCHTPTPTPPPIGEPTPTPTTPSAPTPTPPAGGPPGVGGPADGGGGQAAGCNAAIPSIPTLLTVTSVGLGQANLTWSAVDPTTHYAISYGLSSGNYIYGVADTGKTTSFTIGELDPAAKYCFAVRAVNGCAPGDLSNEICQGAVGGGRVLGVSTLGATGTLDDDLLPLLFIMGSICASAGLRLLAPRKLD